MSSADRVSELLDKWLISLELHAQYTQLSDLAYSCVQPWPKHDRPTRWVVQIAREKTLLLRQHCQARRAAGDEQFAESLELMLTLANLVGLQHIQRFIPLADPARAHPIASEAPADTPDFAALIRPADAAAQPDPAMIEPTRELPQLKVPAPAARSKPAADARQTRAAAQRRLSVAPAHAAGRSLPAPSARVGASIATTPASTIRAAADATTASSAAAQTVMRSPVANAATASMSTAAMTPQAAHPPQSRPAKSPKHIAAAAAVLPPETAASASDTQEMPMPSRLAPAIKTPGAASAEASPAMEAETLTPAERTVIADAIRLLKWGRPWHELAELVSRIADRPGITQVRRILRTHRADIEARADAD